MPLPKPVVDQDRKAETAKKKEIYHQKKQKNKKKTDEEKKERTVTIQETKEEHFIYP